MTQAAKVFVAGATLLVGIVTLIVAVGVFIIISGSRQQQTLDQLKAGQAVQQELLDRAAEDRRLIVEQGKLLVECTTPSPPADAVPPGDDGKHECFESGQTRTGEAVGGIVRAQIAVAECVRDTDPAVDACVARRLASPTPPPP